MKKNKINRDFGLLMFVIFLILSIYPYLKNEEDIKAIQLAFGKTDNSADMRKEWLSKYDLIDCVAEITSEKPHANIYIDDRGYRFNNWTDTLKEIEDLF